MPHRGQQLADDDRPPGRRHPVLEPLLHGVHDLVEREPLGQVLLGRVAHLGVHDTVGGQVLDALAGHPVSAGAVCITATVWSNVSR